VECDEIQTRARGGGDLREPGVVQHLRACETCAAMIAAAPLLGARTPGAAASPSASALATAIASDGGAAAALRSWSTPLRRTVGAALVLAVPVLVMTLWPRPDHAAYPVLRWIFELAALFVVIAAASWIALRPLHRPDHGGARWVALFGVLVTVVLASLPAIDSSISPHGTDSLSGAPWCFVFGTACAVPTWLGLRVLARDGDRLGMRADVVAAASAGVGALAVFLHCPTGAHGHLWAGHVTVLALPWLLALRLRRR